MPAVEDSGYNLESPRILWVSALIGAASIFAVLVVRAVALRVLRPDPAFLPLTPEPPIIDTFLCTVVAVFVFIRIALYPNPVRTWR